MAQDRHKRVARPKVYSYLIVSNASRIQPISTLVTVHEDWCIPKKGATRNQILSWAVLPGILAAMDGSMRLPEPTRPPSWLQRPLTTFTTQDYQFMLQATARAYGGRDQHGGRDQQWWGQRSWYQDLREMRSYRAVVDENRLLRQLHGTMQSDKEREQSEKQRALECLTQETAEKQRALEALTQERATKQRALQALSLETAEKQRALEALATGNSCKRAGPASSCRGGSLQGKSVEVPKKHEVVQWGQEGLDASLDFLLLARFFFWFFVPRKLYVLMLRTLTVFRPGPGCSHQRSGIEGCQQGTAQTEGMVRCLFVICILPQTVRILAAFFHSRGFSEILGWSAMGSLEDSFYQRSCECFAVQSY